MLVLALLIVAPPAQADDDPAKADFELQPVRRQILPGAVDMIYVGPDERIWRVEYSGKNSYRAARRRIEAEFHSPTPLLLNARIVYFEPGGRIWFTVPDGNREHGHTFQRYGRLFGYDGQTVIEREADERKYFEVGCRNHAVDEQGHAVKVDGKLFFPDTHGVHVFDGNDWSYKAFVEKATHDNKQSVMLLPEPDRRGLVAVCRTDSPRAWRCRDGQWRPLQLPSWTETDDETGKTRRRAYEVRSAGIAYGRLWTTNDGLVLRSVELDPPERKREVGPLIADLAADAYQTREAATSNLIARGEAIRPTLEAALEDANDPERAGRLRHILEQLAADDEPHWQFGPYRLAKSHIQMHQDARGRMLLAAVKIYRDGQRVGPGLIVVDPNGRDRYYAKSDLGSGHIWGMINNVLVVDEHRVWLVPRWRGDPATLIDLERGKVVGRILGKAGHEIRAVMPDGRALSVVAATPVVRQVNAPHPAGEIETDWVAVDKKMPWTVGMDGVLWYVTPDQRIVRDDGKAAQVVARQPMSWRNDVMLAGDGGVLLTTRGLYDGNTWHPHRDLRQLVRKHRDVVAAAFGPMDPPAGPMRWYQSLRVCADRDGHIWMKRDEQFGVLVGERWVDVRGALESAEQEWSRLTPVGDGSRVYATVDDPKRAVLLRVEQGQIVAEPAPFGKGGGRDSRGDLWVSANGPDADDDGDEDAWLTRISHEGAEAVMPMPRRTSVRLVDDDDNVWLKSTGGSRQTRFRIVRDGEVVKQLDCPVQLPGWAMVCDGPGSVYALSARGLEHFVTDPDRPGDYRLDAVYPLDHVYLNYYDMPVRLTSGRRLVCEAQMWVDETAPREVDGLQIIPLPDPR